MNASELEKRECRRRWAWWRGEWRYSVANKDPQRDIDDARKQMRLAAEARAIWAAVARNDRAKQFGAAPGWPSLPSSAEQPKPRRWAVVAWPKYHNGEYQLLSGRYETREGAELASDTAARISGRTMMVVEVAGLTGQPHAPDAEPTANGALNGEGKAL